MDRQPSSDDLIREAKAWADPPGDAGRAVAPPPPLPPASESDERFYPSQRIGQREPFPTPSAPPRTHPVPIAAVGSRGAGLKFAMLVAVIGVALGGFFAYRTITAGDEVSILTITPGTCFMDPSGATVTGVRVVDCTTSHDLEAFAVVTLPFADGIPIPADEELFGSAYDQCLPFFEPYTGEPYDSSPWYVDAFVPDRRGWKAGDRQALCVLFLTGSDGFLTPNSEPAGA
jgi:hypothetical protein